VSRGWCKFELLPISAGMNSILEKRTRLFGEITSLLCLLPSRNEQRLGSLTTLYWPAFRHQQLRIFLDEFGAAYGFVVWADVDDECHQRILRAQAVSLHISEWNCGFNRWIIDLAWLPEKRRDFLSQCLNLLYRDSPLGQRIELSFRSIRFNPSP